MNNTQNRTITIFAIILVVVLLILVIGYFVLSNKNPPNQPPAPVTVTPTTGSAVVPTTIESKLTPTGVNVEPRFTGGEGGNLTKAEIDAGNQRDDLISKSPLQLPAFTVRYSYDEDIFIVTLKSPIDQSRAEFNTWLKNNYPLLPINRFQF